jgi:hypothetical protein
MKQPLFTFNRGRVSPLSLGRVDQKRVAVSAEIQTNWIPRIMGPMSLRPGWQYIDSTLSNNTAKYLKFIFSIDDTALVELTDSAMRVLVDESVVTRPSVSSAVTNGTFTSDVSGWTDSDEAGGTSVWVTGGYLGLTGNGTAAAIRDQTVTVAAGDQGIVHALDIVIERGPVGIRVGSAAGTDDYIGETFLETGSHSIAFTPTGNFHIRLFSRLKRQVLVDSCDVASSGEMVLVTPWSESDLDNVRPEQSGDVIYIACKGQQQRRIERRGTESWSVVRFVPEDGPLEVENISATTITPGAISGNTTLTASTGIFRSTNVGSLYQITSIGQTVEKNITSENDFSNTIKITGTGASQRTFTIVIDTQPDDQAITNAVNNGSGLIRITCVAHGGSTGQIVVIAGVTGTTEANGIWTVTVIDDDTFDLQGSAFVNPYVSGGTATYLYAATVTLQYSLDSDTGPWSDVSGKTWTTDKTETYNDGLNNQIVWYRLGVKTGDFVSGAVDVSMSISSGTITGVARVTGYTSETVVDAEVLSDLGGTDATEFWAEGSWSDRRGWPSAVALHDGRLWFAGIDRIWSSVSDSFSSYDPLYEGDAGPIARSIGTGPVDTVNWLLSLQRLILGGQGAEHSARASSLDEPLTPFNFGMRQCSTQGSAPVEAAQIDQTGIYVQRGGHKLYEIAFNGEAYDYASSDLTILVPEIGSPGIVRMGIQRQPETRIHAIRSDGTVALGVFDRAEEVLSWQDIETDGEVEDVVILPGLNGSAEDRVYYSVKRTINGSDVRFLEKWAIETDCRGGTLNKQADSFVIYSGAATATITGLAHLEGESVVVWADGADVGTKDDYTQTYTVSGGQITLATAASNVVVGLPYTAQWKSAKLAAMEKTIVDSLISLKNLDHLGLLLAWVHAKGLRYGPDFDNLDDMPEIEAGTAVGSNAVRTSYDEESIEFPGTWDVDARICLQAQAPRPCTVKALVPDMSVGR